MPVNSDKIRFHCKNCGQRMGVPQTYAGKKGKCPKCKNPVLVPCVKTEPGDDTPTITAASFTCREAVEPHNQQSDESKKLKFTLSSSNKIFFGCAFALYVTIFVAFAKKSAYQMEEFWHGIVQLMLVPLAISWVSWHISGKRRAAAVIAYNIVLSLIIFGMLTLAVGSLRDAQKDRALKGLMADQEAFRQKLSDSNLTAEQANLMLDDYFEKGRTTFEDLGNKSTGIEARLYKVMSESLAETEGVVRAWRESYMAVLDPNILDLSLLKSEEEIERQEEILGTYVTETRRYREYFLKMVENLEKRLTPLGLQNGHVKRALNGATGGYNRQRPLMIPLFQAHIENGESMKEILNILEAEFGKWSYKDDTLLFEDEANLKRIMELYQRIGELEEEIRLLSSKVADVL